MSLITPAKFQAAFLNFNTIFQETLKKQPLYWDKIATLMPSSTSEERYPFLDSMPEMREWLGEREMLNLATRIYSLANKHYERAFKVPIDAFEDDRLGVYAQGVKMLAEAASLWPDKLVTDALQAGTSSLCYDNQNFFDTVHPSDMDAAGAGSQSNNLTLALDFAGYGTARTTMMSYSTKDGVPLGVVPDKLIVPPQLEATGRLILNSLFLPNAAGTAPQSNIWNGSAELVVVPRLANEATTWYLACTSRVMKPLIFQQRMAPRFSQQTNPSDPSVFSRNEFVYGVDSRGAAGYGPWFLALRSKP